MSSLNNSALIGGGSAVTPASPSELSFYGAGNGGGIGAIHDGISGGYDDYDDGNYLGSSGVGGGGFDGSASGLGLGGGGGGSGDRSDSNFKVVIRVRPPLPRELHGDRPFQNVVRVDSTERALILSENLTALEEAGANGGNPPALIGPYSTHCFTFDHVYDQHCDQRKVYETTAKSVVESSLSGYNATIFAYGQTGTGKTYTMEGFNSAEERGIIPRAIEQIFRHIQSSMSPRMRFLVRASYLQIYNEVISDLLKPERSNLLIREDKKKGVFVEGLSEWVVRSPAEIYGLMERGGATRATASTKMNEISSRSHAVFIVIVEQSETTYTDESGQEMTADEFSRLVKARAAAAAGGADGAGGNGSGPAGLKSLEANIRQSFKVGKLNLVDLAGSERVRLTGATGQRLEESKKINQSLSALGNVIASLTENRPHIPYRDSKLTRILEDSLGGNCKTTMMAMISPALEAFAESLSTLKFANRAKNIKNEARVNEDLDQKSLLRRYERELKRLRAELEERSRSVVDQRRLLELDEQRRRAEEDKMAAIRALEARSREFMKEKAEKKRLEERIQLLQGQIMSGGAIALNNLTDMPAFRNALKEHQEKIRMEYEGRLQELEKERETIEEEKAQVDRYKQLLLKQRDIMILLTQRLNERDEQIVALQDELDAYDGHQKELEERLDEKTAALIHLQRVTMEHNAASPVKNSDLVEALGDWAGAAQAARAAGQAILSAGGPSSLSSSSVAQGGAPAPPATSLIATRQFRPYDDSLPSATATTAPVASASSDGGSSAPLLTADEKISELASLIDALRSDRERLGRELEDVRSEKVSMEYLLREKLEKLVQTEIEARLATYASTRSSSSSSAADGTPTNGAAAMPSPSASASASSAASSAMAGELASAKAEIARLRSALESQQHQQQPPQSSPGGESSSSSAAAAALKERVESHEKERRAIHTIMENKIKTLVDAVANAAAAMSASPSSSSPADGQQAKQLQREVQALQRLVNASVAAMKNSELYQPPAASTSATAATPAPSTVSPPAVMPATVTKAPAVLPSPMGSVSSNGNSSKAGGYFPPMTPNSAAAVANAPMSVSIEALIAQRKEELLQRTRQQQQQQQAALAGRAGPAVGGGAAPGSTSKR